MILGTERNLGWWSKLSIGAAVGAVIVEKSVDWLFNTSLFSESRNALKGLWFWLLSDLPMPTGLVIGPLVLCLFLLGLSSYYLRSYNRAMDELEALRNPPRPRLNNAEHDVIMTVAEFWNSERSPNERDVRSHLNMTPLAVHAALDGLVSWKLVEPSGNRWDGFAIGLTPKGRTYVQHPESIARRNRKLG